MTGEARLTYFGSGIASQSINEGNAAPGGSNTALSGIAVTVLDEYGNTAASTTTASDGSYSVSLAPGTYTIELALPSGDVLEGSASNALAPITVLSGQAFTANAGLVPGGGSAMVAGFAWSDAANDGVRDLSEATVSGVEVELLSSSDTVVATTATNSEGYYEFSGLTAGTYSVEFIIPSSDTGAAFSTQGMSTDPTVSSSADASGYTDQFTLSSGQEWLDENVGLTGIPV